MRAWLAVFVTLVVGRALGDAPVFYDSFDVLYGNGYTFEVPSNGWQASSAAAMVTNAGGYSGQSVVLSGTVGLTNTVVTSSSPNLKTWTDLRIKPQGGGDTTAATYTNTSSFVCYFTASGYVAVATALGWMVCSNDVWGDAVPPVSNDYARVAIFQDYTTHTQAVFLNGQLILQDVPFAGTYGGLSRLGLDNSHDQCWLDDVWAKTNIGPDSVANDRNGNGTNDALEVYLYGYAGRTQYVGAVGYPTYTNITDAVNVGRPLDILYVPGGSYTGDVTVLSALRFAGSAFTNIGSLMVRTATSPVIPMATSWDSVTLDSNSVAAFSQALLCSNLMVRSGATGTVQAVGCSNVTVEADAQLNLAAGQSLSVLSMMVSGAVSVAAGATTTVATALSVPDGGYMDFTEATFLYDPLSVAMSGTFSLSNNWGQGGAMDVSAGANCTFLQALTSPPLTDLTVGTNATVTFSQAVACSNFMIRSGATVAAQAVDGSNMTVEAGAQLNLAAGQFLSTLSMMVSGAVSVAAGATTTVATALGVPDGGHVDFTEATFLYPPLSLAMSGTFSLSNQWGQGGAVDVSAGANCTFLEALTSPPVANLTVGTNATVTFQAVACSSLVVRAGATVVLQALTCSNLVVEAGATVTLADGATLLALDNAGTVIVGAGKTVTVNDAEVSGSMQVTGAGTLSVTGILTLSGGGQIAVTGSRVMVPGVDVDMTGTFTLDAATWGMEATLPLPFDDGFEAYAPDTIVARLGFRGWYASDDAVTVQTAIKHGGDKAMEVTRGSVISNRVDSAAATKVWTDFVFRPSPGVEPAAATTNGRSFVAYVNTNGALVVATNGGWRVCASNINNTAPVVLTSNDFSRITVFSDLEAHTFAVFVNSNLVAQGLGSPAGLDVVSVFGIDNPADADVPAYVDDVLLATTVAAGTVDLNRDGAPDAEELDREGVVVFGMRGTAYYFR